MDTSPNWEPAKKVVPDLLSDLMCMHTIEYDGVPITSYKHIETRRYINVDAQGAAYNVEDVNGEPTPTEIRLEDARAYLLS